MPGPGGFERVAVVGLVASDEQRGPRSERPNDHLGDGYWAVGRKMEARFQWHRALSFGPEPAEADRIRKKLDVGLDKVLQLEGAAPLAVAKDG